MKIFAVIFLTSMGIQSITAATINGDINGIGPNVTAAIVRGSGNLNVLRKQDNFVDIIGGNVNGNVGNGLLSGNAGGKIRVVDGEGVIADGHGNLAVGDVGGSGPIFEVSGDGNVVVGKGLKAGDNSNGDGLLSKLTGGYLQSGLNLDAAGA